LIALSHLGVNTAPLIAGASVFGLAVSFGSQALVRDIISGLFYMWDDAFRVGEYIDTGRLKGTVETLGVRPVKLRHQNGPLHTIPYGQLGAVTNLSRDYATIKFNLRFEPATDIELVRKTTKQLGLAMLRTTPSWPPRSSCRLNCRASPRSPTTRWCCASSSPRGRSSRAGCSENT
jgi:moderate conductance mechanosensitive channel